MLAQPLGTGHKEAVSPQGREHSLLPAALYTASICSPWDRGLGSIVALPAPQHCRPRARFPAGSPCSQLLPSAASPRCPQRCPLGRTKASAQPPAPPSVLGSGFLPCPQRSCCSFLVATQISSPPTAVCSSRCAAAPAALRSRLAAILHFLPAPLARDEEAAAARLASPVYYRAEPGRGKGGRADRNEGSGEGRRWKGRPYESHRPQHREASGGGRKLRGEKESGRLADVWGRSCELGAVLGCSILPLPTQLQAIPSDPQ